MLLQIFSLQSCYQFTTLINQESLPSVTFYETAEEKLGTCHLNSFADWITNARSNVASFHQHCLTS